MNGKDKKNKIAWSDDLSYNSEEEREKELALAELAEIETPEKPSYSDDDMEKLVGYVKRMTTLCHLSATDWNDDCIDAIKQFFMEPKCFILTIFYHDNKLTATLNVPDVPIYDMTYFLREIDFIFSVENFHDEITFGTIVKSVEETLLKMLEYVYGPAFISETRWPTSVKNEFCLQLHMFLLKLTDTNNKKLGLTIMYIPREGLDLSVEEACANKELLKRFENIVFYWIQQIQSFLKDDIMPIIQNELLCPADELDFWIYRYENLSIIRYQLKNPNVEHISNILASTHSSNIKQFKCLCDRVEGSMNESTSNIQYLEIIKESCAAMENEKNLDELKIHITEILHKFRFIWTESPFYNTEKRMTNLCHYLSNQVIIQCRVSVNLNSLFDGNTRTAIEELRKCIDCCKTYRELYDSISEAHNEVDRESWILNTDVIFNYVDSFVQRCSDMLEVCNCMIIFGRFDEKEKLDRPRFSGTKGQKFESECEKIEILFKEALSKVKSVRNCILDVQAENWYEIMQDYRKTIKYIEMLIENLLHEIFKSVNNVEEAVQTLCSTHIYSKRESLRKFFIEKTTEVWKIFGLEIEHTKRDIIADRNCHPSGMSPYLGQILMLRMRKNHLMYLNKIMDSAIWMLKCNNSNDVKKQYNEIIGTMNNTMNNILNAWNASLDDKLIFGLNRTLISRSRNHAGLIESNFDRVILQFYDELFHCDNINLEIPQNFVRVHISDNINLSMSIVQCLINDSDIFKIFTDMKMTKLIYEGVLSIVIGYNRIQLSLSNNERELFNPMNNICLKKIDKGIITYVWNSSHLDNYIEECSNQINEVKIFLNYYKGSNQNILKLLEELCNISLIDFSILRMYNLETLKCEIQAFCNNSVQHILGIYKNICKYVTIVYEGFEEYIDIIFKKWLEYIKHIDSLFAYSLQLCVRNSLKVLYTKIEGENDSNPFLDVKTFIEDNKICVHPGREEINEFFVNIFSDLIKIMRYFSRLCKKLDLPVGDQMKFEDIIQNDIECNKYQENIINVTKNAFNAINDHLKSWNMFNHLWTISTNEILKEYLLSNPTAKEFEKDILRYSNMVSEIQACDTTIQLNFILMDNSNLKSTIIKYCLEWQEAFEMALKNCTIKDIKDVYGYMKLNSDALRPPNSLVELQETMEIYDRLCAEITQKEEIITNVDDKVELLAKLHIELSEGSKNDLKKLPKSWNNYKALLYNFEDTIMHSKIDLKKDMLNQVEDFNNRVDILMKSLQDILPKSSKNSSSQALLLLDNIKKDILNEIVNEQDMFKSLNILNLSSIPNNEIIITNMRLTELEDIWRMVEKWNNAQLNFNSSSFIELDVADMDEIVSEYLGIFTKMSNMHKDKNYDIINHTVYQIERIKKIIPLLEILINPKMKETHWMEISKCLNSVLDKNINLDELLKMDPQFHYNEIFEISNGATIEYNIEQGLKTITDIWSTTMFRMEQQNNDVYKIINTDECMQYFEDHQIQLSAMKSTKYVEPLIDWVEHWERVLNEAAEILELALQVQRRWLYLDNVFRGADIKKQLKNESVIFYVLTGDWKYITMKMYMSKNAIDATHYELSADLSNKLNDLIVKLEKLILQLETYLEIKRQIFPRFYFISNDDLIEILGNANNPVVIQPHLKKIFDSFEKMKIEKDKNGVCIVKGMASADGEIIDWKNFVTITGPAEAWLKDLENNMRMELKQILIQTRLALKKIGLKRKLWIEQWPGQLLITSSKIQWTSDCITFLQICKIAKNRRYLKKLKKRQQLILNVLLEIIRGDISKLLQSKVNTLAVMEIHSRDVVDRLYKNNCIDASSFEWFSQLKFFWDKEKNDCVIRQTNTENPFTYEYIGNSGRLVITPLTERCYITLTMALNLYRGGSLQGPAGTGKTETVKDLGRAMARWVVITNCSEGLDYKSLGKCFAGIAQSGCWGCFDEFNRINVEVLSVVAQQISSILVAMSKGLNRFSFDGVEVNLVDTCGIFVTMNPGYAGRTDLPDNLKSMFRPISMIIPDNLIIAEITLFSDGFEDYKTNARKVFTLYELSKIQLSKQYHYDFGLRSMVALLRYAGVKRRQLPKLSEEEIILLAMRDMNTTRLTANDVPLFNGILRDIYPHCQNSVVDYSVLKEAIIEEMRLEGLQPIAIGIEKIIQLMETKNSRHATMLLGDTNTAKSTTWNILRKSFNNLKRKLINGFECVQHFPLNPKVLSVAELYGEYNLSTGEWRDGILSSIMRNVCRDESSDLKWILFDGPVDSLWIENLNSVMDDNKLLTLINSERISMPSTVTLLFEVLDLAVASPATVSRCGIVYNDYKDWGWQPLVDSWLETVKHDKSREHFRELFEKYLNKILTFKRDNLMDGPGSECHELTGVRGLCNLLNIFAFTSNTTRDDSNEYENETLRKMWFIFCIIWSICATLDDMSRRKLNIWLRELVPVFPSKLTVYDYYLDVDLCQFIPWEEKLSPSWSYNLDDGYHNIIVPTAEMLRVKYLTTSLVQSGINVFIGGPIGAGKTSLLKSVLSNFDDKSFSKLIINLSASTSSTSIQNIIETRLEKRGKFVPFGNKVLLSYVDDINMPEKDEYGSQPPLELLRQYLDYGFWYDREKQTKKEIKKIILLVSGGIPGGARSCLPARFSSCFHSFYLPAPSQSQLNKIFGTIITQHFSEFTKEIKNIGKVIVNASIDLFHNVILKLLPTPTKLHYIFNLRDLSKIFQGLLRSDKEYHSSSNLILRLWIHESFRIFCDRLNNDNDSESFHQMLNKILEQYFDTTLNILCPEKKYPVFGNFMNEYNIYEDISDMNTLKDYTVMKLKEYNDYAGAKKFDIPFIRETLENITRIARVISQPTGHMLLIGLDGSGRRCLSRLATFMCGYKSFEINVTRNYGLKEFREDLKAVYVGTGVEHKHTTFIFGDNQIQEESFCEIINNLLSSGEIVNLFKPDEFDNIKGRLEKKMKYAGIIQTNESIYKYLIDNVIKHLHVVFRISPIGDQFRNRLRQYPALIDNTTIIWFLEAPKEALYEIAYKYLHGVDLPMNTDSVEGYMDDSFKKSIGNVLSCIHVSVRIWNIEMLNNINRRNYISLSKFILLLTTYESMLKNKYMKMKSNVKKLENGLLKLDEARVGIETMSGELINAKKQVFEYTEECDTYLKILNEKRQNANIQKEEIEMSRKKTAEEESECKLLADAAKDDLESAMPALKKAMQALNSLNKKDITEIKSYAKPPSKIEMVLEAVMILLQAEPTWAEAKRQMTDQYFLEHLKNFDKNNITDKVLRKVSLYTSNPDFQPDIVGIVSLPAKSLCLWVIAIEKYGQIFKIVKPKQDKLDETMQFLNIKHQILASEEKKLNLLGDTIDSLQIQYDEKCLQKEELSQRAIELQTKLDRAAALVDGLGGEKQRWEETVAHSQIELSTLLVDCLIASVFLIYMGPFPSEYRDMIFAEWSKIIIDNKLPYKSDCNIRNFLIDDLIVREWNIYGLPGDNFSIENGIILKHSKNIPLLIDPQGQAVTWLSNMEEKNNLIILEFEQNDFSQLLKKSLIEGTPVLIQDTKEFLDPVINPILNGEFVTIGDRVVIEFNNQVIDYNSNFRLYLTTKYGNPKYSPDLLRKTTLINFSIKENGLQEQLLCIVIQKEAPDLEKIKNDLVLNIATGKKTLYDSENELLRMMSESTGSLLDNENFFKTLQTSKITTVRIKEGLLSSEQTEMDINETRKGYMPVAERAATLFFVLKDLANIDSMYQFSLDGYINIFNLSFENSDKSDNLNERIKNLNEYHTYSVYNYTCRALFERHKLVFTFYMLTRILNLNNTSKLEYEFLLKGGVVLNRDDQPHNPADWISEECWDNITELDKLCPGVVESFKSNSIDWYNWYSHQAPETIPLIGEFNEICDDFQKLLFIRSLRIDRLFSSIMIFIMKALNRTYIEHPSINLKDVLDESNAKIPLLFILSPGVDPLALIRQLAIECGKEDEFQYLSLGQGQSEFAERMVEFASKTGGWVYLANCHLACDWLGNYQGLHNTNVHPNFRLLLSSLPDARFPLSILQKSIKITTEPPKGLKSNLENILTKVDEDMYNKSTDTYRKLIFCMAFYHSTLIARKRFRQLGYNIVYNFSISDFKVSENMLSVYLDIYNDIPWSTLKYLFAAINYGGHVTDDWDMCVLNAYIDDMLCSEALESDYSFSADQLYRIPRVNSIESYRDYVDSLPLLETANSIGLHNISDLKCEAQEGKYMCDSLLAVSFAAGSSDKIASDDEKIYQLISDILLKLPMLMDIKKIEKTMDLDLPLCVVLQQELVYFNDVIECINDNLTEMKRAMDGFIVMSEDLEMINKSISEGKVPPLWIRARPSIKPLGSWCRELSERAAYLSEWCKTPLNPSAVQWLAAFNSPTAFLAAVLQTKARKDKCPIDTLCWEFTVMNDDDSLATRVLDDGVILRGLYLEGANWSIEQNHLIEPQGMQTIFPMSPIHLNPVNVDNKKSKRKYLCPTYYYPLRTGTFILAIELAIGNENPAHWTKHGTALLCSLG